MARRKRGLFDPRKRSDAERFYEDTYWERHPEEAEEMEAQRKFKEKLDARVAERMRYNKMSPLQQYEYDRQRYQEWYNGVRQSLERVAETCGWEKAEAMRKEAEVHHQVSFPEVYTNNPAVLNDIAKEAGYASWEHAEYLQVTLEQLDHLKAIGDDEGHCNLYFEYLEKVKQFTT